MAMDTIEHLTEGSLGAALSRLGIPVSDRIANDPAPGEKAAA